MPGVSQSKGGRGHLSFPKGGHKTYSTITRLSGRGLNDYQASILDIFIFGVKMLRCSELLTCDKYVQINDISLELYREKGNNH